MRAKRSKKYRKIMQQYQLNFGFREPYQVLVDTHLLLAIRAFSMPLLPSLERTLHGKVRPFITKCSLAAITSDQAPSKRTNSEPIARPRRPDYLPTPTELPLRHCDHGDRGILDESQCLLELVSGGAGATLTGEVSEGKSGKQPKNREHYIIATADVEAGRKIAPPQNSGQKRKRDTMIEDLRPVIREVPGVPIIYVKRSVMILEELGGASMGQRRQEEKDKMAEGFVMGLRKQSLQTKEGDADNEEGRESGAIPRRMASKKAKGPNPLSVKKKKKIRVQSNGVRNEQKAEADGGSDEESGKQQAKRRRKHSKKSSGEQDENQPITATITE